MSTDACMLELRQVERSFPAPRGGRRDVLRGVDLRVSPGDFMVMTGPSGSGKTTMLNLMALLDEPDAGTVLFSGCNVGQLGERERCRIRGNSIGMVFQRFHLLPYRSALENVIFRFRYLNLPAALCRQRAADALAETGLTDLADAPARLLSAGEMQRVALARAVATEPSLLLADEPTGNLDAEAARCVMNILYALNAKGMTVVMVTHNEALVGKGMRHAVCRGGVLT